jgi:hypothetical protein
MSGRSRTRSPKTAPQLEEALAALISSTRNKQRPLPLTQISKWLGIAFSKLGSYSAISERVGISSKMLGQFASVDRLTKSVRRLFADRTLDSVDAAVHLAMLTPADQEPVARALAKNLIDTMDIRAVVQLRQVRESEPIESLLARIQKTKTQHHYVMEFVARETKDPQNVRTTLEKYVRSSDIVSLELDGALGRLVVTAQGKKKLELVASNFGIPFKSVIQKILSERVWQK